ncbi:glucose-6-phosphate dehydrogenase [Buchnera aphidicola]|uniref:Glucose-6-phosphate 1-dehydrogenase n=1 Tax=Buchnera aphidicola (Cinara strobi) TaxID=1921549 RepID=A0A3B1DLJ0_9GAMM|nr:glucose-6-phosphate dehydrogenase [Buchnera aphidicola]VAX76571.1 Glucose-6-phosphate 1-dehydrogenase [Buchnera aphidicola (Cinara strobi)]
MIKNRNYYYLIIFGTTGDLSIRKLFPALYKLEQKKKINKRMKIIGISRLNYTLNEYTQIIYKSLKIFFNQDLHLKTWNIFKERLIFCQMDVNHINDFIKLKKILTKTNKILVNYFAVSSEIFTKICKGLKFIQCNQKNSKIIIEKPIGKSLENFYNIDESIKKYFTEKQIFRIDHYLGKESILNLISLKFANSFFSNCFKKNNIDHIQITLSEILGIEKRWNYFNQTGQIIDMVQNHILQIISILAMNTPKSLTKKHISEEKIKILKSLCVINDANISNHVSFGQYSEGKINNKIKKSYLNERGAKSGSLTETFVAIKLFINTKKWKNIPFYVRTGKRLSKKSSKITIFFKKNINLLFSIPKLENVENKLIINLQPPYDIKIKFFNKKPSLNSKFILKPCEINFNYQLFFKNSYIPSEYETLILESIKDNQFLFVHPKEIIYSWKWIDPIIQAYKKNPSLLQNYSAGTWGPQSSDLLIKKDRRQWNNS